MANVAFEKITKDHFNLSARNSAKHFYHLCSKGTRNDNLFETNEEFAMGMNLVALAVASCHVKILAFCLMSNHFHFILSASEEEVIEFKIKINTLYMHRKIFMRHRKVLEKIHWSTFLINDLKYLQHSIAYVINNPINAFYDQFPMYYPWSSSGLYFKDYTYERFQCMKFRKIGELSNAEYRTLLGTHNELPKKWYVTNMNYIWPGCYVTWQWVEYIFRSAKIMMMFLNTKEENNLAAISLHEVEGK